MALGDPIDLGRYGIVSASECAEAEIRDRENTQRVSTYFDSFIVGPISERRLPKLGGMRFAGNCAASRNKVLARVEVDLTYGHGR